MGGRGGFTEEREGALGEETAPDAGDGWSLGQDAVNGGGAGPGRGPKGPGEGGVKAAGGGGHPRGERGEELGGEAPKKKREKRGILNFSKRKKRIILDFL